MAIVTGTSAADSLVGTASDDTITGGQGDDTIDSGLGVDTVDGEEGSDLLEVNYSTSAGAVTLTINDLNLGNGLVSDGINSVTFSNIERLSLRGSAFADSLAGLLGNDTILGDDGDDTISAGAGTDSVDGEAGTDRLVVDYSGSTSAVVSSITDLVAGEGSLTAGVDSVTFTSIEQLVLTGSGLGDDLKGLSGSSTLSGGVGNDTLSAATANDVLTGGLGGDSLSGGTGNDTMTGGDGDDTYVVTATTDVVTENSSEGTDLVESAVTYTLGADVENLTLTGTSAISGKGNTLDNLLTGNSASNTLTGGVGNDSYVVASTGDVVTELGSEGTDLIISTVSLTLVSNVENLTLSGTSAINATGNSLGNVLTGNGAANSLNGGLGDDAMSGGSGDDTYAVDAAGDVVSEVASQGTDLVQVGFSYTLGAELEKLTLTGTLAADGTGNTLANTLTGNTGANVLDGGTGIDSMSGGTGNDTYVVNVSGDVATESSSAGTDVVQSTANYTLGANVENIILTGSGSINATGNTSNNLLTGNAGDNLLDGSTGNDTMVGGDGNDTYGVGVLTDVVTENTNEGTDLVKSAVTYTLGSNLENLTLDGATAINGKGNTQDNVVTGNTAANLLDGGLGIDTLVGGSGNDTYVVDDTTEVVTDTGSADTDLVQAGVSYTLGANLEKLTLTGTATNATGNTLGNVLTGNAEANVLDGGSGSDTLVGAAGDDTYLVNASADVITESSSSGTDVVLASTTYTLGSNVENITMAGSSAINGTGNTLGNVLTGNSAANLLDGSTGADSFFGGDGNDTYGVDSLSDVVTEATASGTDVVLASLTYTLGAEVENLTLSGTSAINGTGNSLANVLTGNTAANELDGGTGNDSMAGGIGNDTYVVDAVTDVVTEGASAGTDLVEAALTVTLSSNVENLTLTGTASVSGTGNALGNVLTGNSAGNSLDGSDGSDTLDGGGGDDTYVVANSGDLVVEAASSGRDLVLSSLTYTLGLDLEDLTLTGTLGLTGIGNTEDNQLTGNTANNILDGFGGSDSLAGGLGNDTYMVDSSDDTITEAAAAGTDLVKATASYTLSAQVENLTLTSTTALDGAGNSSANVLTGNAAANRLDGGAGNDTLVGGTGSDTYGVNAGGDVVTENSGAGTELVEASASYTLSTNVENLTLVGTSAINGTGNTQANELTGNSADNKLDGGTGNDSMAGGGGDDTYVVNVVTDVVTEASDPGTDLVQAAVSYTLGAFVENLTLTGVSGNSATGNSLDNALTGTSGNNLLDGGIGDDALVGGAGNDTYVVDSVADVATEASGGGTDLLQSSVSYTLGAQIENMALLGTGNIDGTGNGLVNLVTGNGSNNRLDGGIGRDSLRGGDGDDTYVISEVNEVVIEVAAEGNDLVESAFSYTLGAFVDNLTLTGTAALNGTGNTFGNVLTGTTGANSLSGGTGVDTLVGGGGNDSYVVDASADVVSELAAEGVDVVQASAGYTLGDNIETLTLTGTANIDAAGNSQDNVITGNSGANRMNGGAGSDTLIGGTGNDTYQMDVATDIITEVSGQGTDLLETFIDWTLADTLENLTLLGTQAITATGNAVNNVLTGNGIGNELNGGNGADTMQGGAGDDTYVLNTASDVVSENNAAGQDLVRSAVAYTLTANVEDLTLTGTLGIAGTGNALGNFISGNAGSNRMDGGAGDDTMDGGVGNDTYVVDSAFDTVSESASEGTDLVQSSVSYTLSADVDNLTLLGAADLSAKGNALANLITGNSGNNRLDGDSGIDSLVGGAGDDTYVVSAAGDLVTENSGAGSDLVEASATYTLAANLENLTLVGVSAIGGTGNSLANVLTGNSGGNLLTGGGGADGFFGAAGNDTYVVDSSTDGVTEASAAGTDMVKSSVSWTLGLNLENLTLTGVSNLSGTGNALANALVGNSAGNILDGGAGADSLQGANGNDTYVVDVSTDVLTEAGGQGIDLVQSSASFTLASNVENLTLTGTANVNGIGNTLNNTLIGNAGNNLLDGDAGSDNFKGGLGNDTYVVAVTNDQVTELGSEGTDQVQSSIAYALGANLENLTLLGIRNINGTGNTLDNVIVGNSGINRLDGLGAVAGQQDTLTGGTSGDVFLLGTLAGRYYDDGSAASAGTGDYAYITDFTPTAGDKLQLKGTASQYLVGSNPVSGISGQAIFFDTDGSKTKTANDELIAVVNSSTTLNLSVHANFIA